jgi:FkbM family methyltransferase
VILSPQETVPLSIPGLTRPLRLRVHGAEDRVISRRIREQGIWEPFETALLLERLGPGDVFVDVGANIGYFTVLAAERVGPDGAVYAFEPDPRNYRLLSSNVSLNRVGSQVTAVAAGLAAAAGAGRLYLSADNLGDHQTHAGEPDRPSVPVTLLGGAEYLSPRIARIDLLKVDTQGFEYEAMLGLMPLLRRQPSPPAVLIELTPFSLRQAGSSGRALIELLAGLDLPFWIVDHVEHRLAPSDARALARWCDNIDGCPGDQGFMNILLAPDA